MADNVVAAVDRQQNGIEAYVKGARGWYAQLVPSHLAPEQFQALLLNMLRTTPKLLRAAERNPLSFKAAANECARLGGTPGVDFYFVPFEYRRGERAGQVEITPMAGWQLEVQQMHKADPSVAAVEVECVRRGGPKPDYFRRPGPGRPLVEHEIADDGLASREERGYLAAVYCYLRYKDGTVSTTTVMAADEVREHFLKAKTPDFWGTWPEGKHPVEKPTTEDMWRKTAIHKHSDKVPKSAEYLQNLVRTATVIAEQASPSGAIIPAAPQRALQPGRRMLTGSVMDDEPETPAAQDDTLPGPGAPDAATAPDADGSNGTRANEPAAGTTRPATESGSSQAPRAARSASPRGAQPPAQRDTTGPASRRDLARIRTRLDDMPIGTPADVADALSFLAGRPVTGTDDLTQGEADLVWAGLEELLSRAQGDFGQAASELWTRIGSAMSGEPDGT